MKVFGIPLLIRVLSFLSRTVVVKTGDCKGPSPERFIEEGTE